LFTGSSFNEKINSLPVSLQKLRLGHYFNQPLEFLPPLTHLYIQSYYFFHNLNALPTTLTHLSIGERYNKPLTELPLSLEWLAIGGRCEHTTPATAFTTTSRFNQAITLPPSLKHLQLPCLFNKSFEHFPPSLTELVVGCCFRQKYIPQRVHVVRPQLEEKKVRPGRRERMGVLVTTHNESKRERKRDTPHKRRQQDQNVVFTPSKKIKIQRIINV
jgi:FNIP Repeat